MVARATIRKDGEKGIADDPMETMAFDKTGHHALDQRRVNWRTQAVPGSTGQALASSATWSAAGRCRLGGLPDLP